MEVLEVEESKLAPEQKAAAVIVSLGADKASKIYKHLSTVGRGIWQEN